jgi:hypothetical protein
MMEINGTYDLKIETPLGEKYATLIHEVEGTTISGSFITKNSSSPISGTTSGNEINFKTTITVAPLGKITARIIGKIEDQKLIAESKLMFAVAKITGLKKIN